MHSKRILLRVFFSVEVLMFSYVYIYGKNSISILVGLQEENRMLESQLQEQKKEMAALENDITEWKADSFYKEKIAREQLQMARANEQVYYRVS